MQNDIIEGASQARVRAPDGLAFFVSYRALAPADTHTSRRQKPYDALEIDRYLWNEAPPGYGRRSPPVFETGFVNLP